jgi:transposase
MYPPAEPGGAARLARYAEAHRFAALGWSWQVIAQLLHVVPETIRHWLRTDSYPAHPGPKRRGRPLGSQLDPYKVHLRQRVAEGCQNGRLLYAEIVARGYAGSYSLLRKWLTPVRRAVEAGQPLPAETDGRYSLADLVFALLRRPEKRSAEEDRLVTALSGVAGAVGQACALTARFATLIRERQAERLTEWLTEAEGSGLAEFQTFVHGLRRDEAAVRAALTEIWSQGPVEGHNHRLKLIKRAMYGRGDVKLLRKRVLLAA